LLGVLLVEDGVGDGLDLDGRTEGFDLKAQQGLEFVLLVGLVVEGVAV
jgi:hypothetical protein